MRDNLTARVWRDFAASCELPPRTVSRVFAELVNGTEAAERLIERSFLDAATL